MWGGVVVDIYCVCVCVSGGLYCDIRSGECGGRERGRLCSIGWPWGLEGRSMVYYWGETKNSEGVGFQPE